MIRTRWMTQLAQCLSASVIIATTHNFDVSTIVSMVRCAARLPAVTHLVLGESRLCTPRCKAICGPCCCFEPLGTEDVPTYWGNSFLSFTVYRRVVPWMLEANEVPRVTDEATLAALNSGELDPQIRQIGAELGGARAVAGSTKAGGSAAAAGCVADVFDGLFWSLGPRDEKATGREGGGSGGSGAGGGAGGAAGGAAGGRHGGVGQPACTSVSLEDVREATARLQRPTNPPEKFSDHDMHVRRHRYPSSRAERRDNRNENAEEAAGEDADDDADDASGDGKASAQQQQQQQQAPTAAADAKGPSIVGRLLKLVGRTD